MLRQHETAAGQQSGKPASEKSERNSRAAAGRPTPPAAPASGAAGPEPADGELREGDAAAEQRSGSPGSWVLREELD